MNQHLDQPSTDVVSDADAPSSNRATGVLLSLIGALVLVFGLLFMAAQGRDAGDEARGDVRLISMQGEPVDIMKHLAPGKFTVIDFYADWCPPCLELTPRLENLAAAHDGLAVRKINVEHWNTPVVAQYGVQSRGLPYLRLYGPDGTMVADGVESVMEEIVARF